MRELTEMIQARTQFTFHIFNRNMYIHAPNDVFIYVHSNIIFNKQKLETIQVFTKVGCLNKLWQLL